MTSNPHHHETAFEQEIEQSLIGSGGYIKADAAQFNRELCLDTKTFIKFLQTSQPKEWKTLSSHFGKDTEQQVIKRVCKEIDETSLWQVLRKGFTTMGVRFKMAFFKPETSMNPDTLRLYGLNRLTVMRQVKYSRSSEKSLDMVLGINGLPVATVELKNPFTGQNVSDAQQQYTRDRDPKELMFQFKKRAFVHFAVDPDEAYMATRINGAQTIYLPFNRGDGTDAGNPVNPDGHTARRTCGKKCGQKIAGWRLWGSLCTWK